MHNGANDAAFTLQVMLSQCGVAFTTPPRTTSNHAASTAFQAAWAEAEAREAARLSRERELQGEVAAFAERLKACAAENEKDAAEMEHRFPPTLSSKERRIVHEACEALGLRSNTQNNGPGGEPCVSIRALGKGKQPKEFRGRQCRGRSQKQRSQERQK